MITIKTGDLLGAKEAIIGHQVNCFGIAGGLAACVFDRWPEAGDDYAQVTQRVKHIKGKQKNLLGMALITGQTRDGHIIANLYGQYYPGADYRPDALEQALMQLASYARETGKSVALPYKISCGICGWDWDEVYAMLERTMDGVDCVIYKRERDT